jgi:uncharacterized protein (TIGR03382 family)
MPKSVWWFEKLMWVSLLLGGVVFSLDWKRVVAKAVHQGANARIPDSLLRTEFEAMTVGAAVTAILTFIVLLILVWLVARRRINWLRWLFGVLFVVALPFALLQLVDTFSANPIAGALSSVQLVLQLVALVLVFLPSARPWFTKPAGGAVPA